MAGFRGLLEPGKREEGLHGLLSPATRPSAGSEGPLRDVAFGRSAGLQGSRPERPEFGRNPSFHSPDGIGFVHAGRPQLGLQVRVGNNQSRFKL
jgi:hypothetical protein